MFNFENDQKVEKNLQKKKKILKILIDSEVKLSKLKLKIS